MKTNLKQHILKSTFLSVFLVFTTLVLGQVNIVSENSNQKELQLITQRSYESLAETFTLHKKNKLKSKLYAQAFLLKAKNEKNTTKKIEGYYMLATVSQSNNDAILYTDSIIAITKDFVNSDYPAKAHLLKANHLGTKSEFQLAMNQLEKANTYANTNENIDQQYEIKYFIALLKNNIGQYEESKGILKKVVSYYEKMNTKNKGYENLYIKSLYAYGNAFNILKRPDSSEIINKKVIVLSLKSKDSILYDRLLMSSAITYYKKGDSQSSLDSIKKFQKIYKNRSSVSMHVLENAYLGKNYLKQNKKSLSEKYFRKADSLIFSNNYFFPLNREVYEFLIENYKEKKDIKNQLLYINKLLVFDSIAEVDLKYLSKRINNNYTTPNLILEKQRIIESLKKKDTTKKIILVLLSILSVSLLIVLVKNNMKRKLYEKNAQSVAERKKDQNHTIDNETTVRILHDLSNIEDSEIFLNKDFSLNVLAKSLNTNTSYLSRIINEHKQKSFKQYLIDIRIKKLIRNLEENPIMRKHSIEALGESIGYNNASSFTRIFKNHIGISPSAYLKETYPDLG